MREAVRAGDAKEQQEDARTDKTGVVIVLLFMVLPGSYFARFHLTSRQ